MARLTRAQQRLMERLAARQLNEQARQNLLDTRSVTDAVAQEVQDPDEFLMDESMDEPMDIAPRSIEPLSAEEFNAGLVPVPATVADPALSAQAFAEMTPRALRELLQSGTEGMSPEQFEAAQSALYDKMIRRRITGARLGRAGEIISDLIGRGASRFRGIEPGATKKQRRQAQEAATRAGAKEVLQEDALAAQKERAELAAAFANDIAARAASALGASDDPAIAAAQQRVSLANKMLDYMKTGGTAKSETQNAKKVAATFLRRVAEGNASDAGSYLNSAFQSMKTLEGLELLRDEINAQQDTLQRMAPQKRDAVDKAMDPNGIYTINYNRRAADPNFPKSLEGFTPEQMRIMKDGDYDLALREAKNALTNLESFPGMQEMMLEIARQTAPEANTVGEAFDAASGMTAEAAQALDRQTLSRQEQALDIIGRTGNYDMLLKNKNMRSFMEDSGLTGPQLPLYLKNRYRYMREQGTDSLSSPKGVAKIASTMEKQRRADDMAAKSVMGLNASRPEATSRPTPGGNLAAKDLKDVDEDEESGTGTGS
jgi:hypothetical protein